MSSTVRTVRSSSSGLRNPVTTLFEEVANEQASWTDAVFWYLVGVLTTAALWWVHH